MEKTIRLFVAVALPDAHKQELQRYAEQYRHETLRLVPEQNLHLTLYFIGNIEEKLVPQITRRLAHIAQEHTTFELQLQEVAPGPTLRQPRLVWARYAESEPFVRLSHALSNSLDLNSNDRLHPVPHVTLGRYRKDQKPPRFPVLPATEPLTLQVKALSLWESKIRQPHPEYSILEEFPLQGRK